MREQMQHYNLRALRRLLAITVFILWPQLSVAMDPDEYLGDAQSYYDKGDYEAAVIQLKNVLLVEPGNAQARLLLGQAYLKLEKGQSAYKELNRARDLGISREVVIPPLGRALLITGQSDELLKSLFIEQDDPVTLKANILLLQGQAYLASRRFELAGDRFSRVLELDPNMADAILGKAHLAYHGKDNARAFELVDQAISLAPDNADAWILKGELLRAANQQQEAVSAFQRALDAAPARLTARMGKAAAHIALGEHEKAMAEIKQIQNAYPDLHLTYYLRALALFQHQETDAAQESVQLALNLEPDHAPSQLLAGTIAYQQGQMNQAERYLRTYWGRHPDNIQASRLLAATLMKLNEPAKAVEVLEPGVSSAADDAQYLALLGSACIASGDSDRGLGYLEKAMSLEPDVAILRAQLAIGQLVQGDVDQAVIELQTAVELEPGLLQADIMLVLIYLAKKEFDAALSATDALVARMPENPVMHNLKGAALLGSGDRPAARNSFENALGLQPDFLPAHINLAQIDLLEGDSAAAKTRYRKVLSYDAGNLKALLALATLAERDGQAEEGEKWLMTAHENHPDEIMPGLRLVQYYQREGKTIKALDVARKMAITHPRDQRVLKNLVVAQLNAGEEDAALATMQTLVEVTPESAEVYYQLALIQLTLEKPGDARESLEEALALRADYPEAQVALGRLDIVDKRYEEALEIASHLRESRPDTGSGYELQGDINHAREEFKQAAEMYVIALEKADSAQVARKLFLSRMQAGEHDTAHEGLRQWLDEHPEDTKIRSMLAMALQSSGQEQQAIEQYLKILETEPDNVIILNNLAWLYQEAGNPEAVKYAQHAHELAPDRPEVTDTLGWLLVQNGETNRGLVLLQEARVKAPHIPDIHYHMAVALYKSGRVDEARKELDRLLRTGKAFPELDEARALHEKLLNP
jgi:putative PEP-CTERM system TPR-repeat lipoprotein